MKKAEILAVGTELVAGQVDTNGPWLCERLAEVGVGVGRITHVRDDAKEIRTAVQEALLRADVVITSGGLGPTGDDLTREVVARVAGRRLVFHPDLLERIQQAFSSRGFKMPPNNRVQAYAPEGAHLLMNDHGTAPGWRLETGRKVIVVLPGPPRELKPMVEQEVLPWLKSWAGSTRILRTRILKVWGLPESSVDERLRDLFRVKNPVLALLASHREVVVRLTASGSKENAVEQILNRTEQVVRKRLGLHIFGTGDDTMSMAVGRLLFKRGWKIAVAESCTGGLIGHLLTETPGSSAYFERGVMTYSNASKTDLLKVPAFLIVEAGAVSPQVAKAMAQGVRRLARTEVGIGVTGIAGPGGATPEKPIGLVYIAADVKGKIILKELHLRGTRTVIKEQSALSALNLVRVALLAQS